MDEVSVEDREPLRIQVQKSCCLRRGKKNATENKFILGEVSVENQEPLRIRIQKIIVVSVGERRMLRGINSYFGEVSVENQEPLRIQAQKILLLP